MEKVKLTEKEFDLIMAIRNYGKSYPDGYPEIRWYIERLFNELMADAEEKKF
ncbi:MAG: ArsR family transcriptional regulator [Bacteroides sp.]|nr:ArsR family transcriptional regulator [Bacteroides sp.]